MVELKWYIPNQRAKDIYLVISHQKYIVYIKDGSYCIVWDNGNNQYGSLKKAFESFKGFIEDNNLGYFEDV